MKILLACPHSSVFRRFRKNLIIKLKELGHSIVGVGFDNECIDEINALDIEYHCINDANRSLNPFKILTLKKRYAKIIKEINPDLVFTFMLKPNIYGVLGAKKAGYDNIYSMVEGAGDVFNNRGLKWYLIRRFVCHGYKKSFKYSKKVFFLNETDLNEFVDRGLVKKEQCETVLGIGVDLEHFDFRPIKNYDSFLMIARLLKTKGVFEYCEAAKIVKRKYPNAKFKLLGVPYTISVNDLKEYMESGTVEYLGVTDDVRPYIEDASVHVLPTYYREGLVVVNMEASSMGRAVITCDNVGTRETVKDGYSGFLVKTKDATAIAEKMIYFLENPDKVCEMGANARKYAEENFDHKVINEKICKIIGLE
ncbi:MAG: glycosyltransferase family 4 protein [Clostridia bacterium]|nr:glycosyltransferase family 4 protein [Clostridia bacterium]